MKALIAAIGRNRELGSQNTLLWNLPDDLKRFKDLTNGSTVVMGRKTFESIGRPLPKRKNIIITKEEIYHAPGCILRTRRCSL
jgi:dihydrofolate reductase